MRTSKESEIESVLWVYLCVGVFVCVCVFVFVCVCNRVQRESESGSKSALLFP